MFDASFRGDFQLRLRLSSAYWFNFCLFLFPSSLSVFLHELLPFVLCFHLVLSPGFQRTLCSFLLVRLCTLHMLGASVGPGNLQGLGHTERRMSSDFHDCGGDACPEADVPPSMRVASTGAVCSRC